MMPTFSDQYIGRIQPEAVPTWWVEQHAGLLVGAVTAVFALLVVGYVVLRRREMRRNVRTGTDQRRQGSVESRRGGRSS